MSDKTAEMVVLAYVSEDEVLRDFITGVDKNMALVRPDRVPEGINPEDVVVRLAFPDYIDSPPDKEKFIMTYASDGVIHATFTEDDLLRDKNGEIVHPGNDSHWQVCEVSRGTCREVMNKKKDRGAGKVVNQMRFLPAETPVSKCGELQGRPTWVICNRALFGGKAQRPSRKGVATSVAKHRTPLGVMTWSALHSNVQPAKAGRGVANHAEHKVLQLLWRHRHLYRPQSGTRHGRENEHRRCAWVAQRYYRQAARRDGVVQVPGGTTEEDDVPAGGERTNSPPAYTTDGHRGSVCAYSRGRHNGAWARVPQLP